MGDKLALTAERKRERKGEQRKGKQGGRKGTISNYEAVEGVSAVPHGQQSVWTNLSSTRLRSTRQLVILSTAVTLESPSLNNTYIHTKENKRLTTQ